MRIEGNCVYVYEEEGEDEELNYRIDANDLRGK